MVDWSLPNRRRCVGSLGPDPDLMRHVTDLSQRWILSPSKLPPMSRGVRDQISSRYRAWYVTRPPKALVQLEVLAWVLAISPSQNEEETVLCPRSEGPPPGATASAPYPTNINHLA